MSSLSRHQLLRRCIPTYTVARFMDVSTGCRYFHCVRIEEGYRTSHICRHPGTHERGTHGYNSYGYCSPSCCPMYDEFYWSDLANPKIDTKHVNLNDLKFSSYVRVPIPMEGESGLDE